MMRFKNQGWNEEIHFLFADTTKMYYIIFHISFIYLLLNTRDHRVRPSGSAVFVHRVARCSLPWAIERRWPPQILAKNTDRGGHFQQTR